MSTDHNGQSPDKNAQMRYAGFSVRANAAIIDFLIFLPAIGISTYNQLSLKSLLLELLIIVALMLYKPFMEWKYQATVGKMVMKIKVIAEDGSPMTVLQSFIRSGIFIANSVISALITIDVFQNPEYQNVETVEQMIDFQQYLNYGSAQDSLGLIMILAVSFVIFDKRHQGVHDKMGRTLVVFLQPLD